MKKDTIKGTISDKDFTQACRNWEKHKGSNNWGEIREDFFLFLDMPTNALNPTHYDCISSELERPVMWWFPETAANRLKLLASPHFETLIKAIKINA